MAFKQIGKAGKYLKFTAGGAYEGLLVSITEKDSPFKPGTPMWDIVIDMGEQGENTLSTSSVFLSSAFKDVLPGTRIRIEMKTIGMKKIYTPMVDELNG